MSGSRMLSRRIIGLLCLLSVGLGACSVGLLAPRVAREDIIGIWEENDCAPPATKSSRCGYFEFFSDGRFTAHNIPTEGFLLESYGIPRATASGSWELGTPPTDPFLFQPIHLRWDLYGTQDVYISGDKNRLRLVADIIDEWRGIFRKQ